MSSPEDAVLVRHHLPTEALAAIKSLSDGEKAALLKVAKVYARTRLTRYGHEDLLQEAIVRVLEGTRRWPTGVPFMAFMCGTMRGIAWDWRGESQDGASDENELAILEEGNAIARIDAQKLLTLFADDPVAQKLIVGMMEGARGEDLWESSGLTRTEYESKRRKIRRRIERLWLEPQ
jgi:DNA-directed RNA polymerase specialized sigma24 family protein